MSNHCACRRTYHTIYKLADHALLIIVRYVQFCTAYDITNSTTRQSFSDPAVSSDSDSD
jgi:hypothetical protein